MLTRSNLSSGVRFRNNLNYLDQRIAGTFVVYPMPLGFVAEYNVGRGPEFNKQTDSIQVQALKGGYVQAMYNLKLGQQTLFPFVRYQYYDGGKKHERDARSYEVRELEIGAEWQPFKQFELVAMYTISNRRYEDFILQNNLQKGRLLRLQAQINF